MFPSNQVSKKLYGVRIFLGIWSHRVIFIHLYIYKILGIPINLLPKKKGIPINKNINFDNNGQTEYEKSALVVLKIIRYKKRKDVLVVDDKIDYSCSKIVTFLSLMPLRYEPKRQEISFRVLLILHSHLNL